MGQPNSLVVKVMTFFINEFAWVDSYIDFGCTTSYYTPFSIFQDGKKADNFSRGKNKYNQMHNIMYFVEGESTGGDG